MIAAVRVVDPGRTALKGAVRVAIVQPAAFALAFVVLDLPQGALFAALGSMSLLAFVEFGGPPRQRLLAYLALAAAGALLIVLGTLCSESTALSVAATAAIGFLVLFGGVLSGYVAAAQPGAILILVLAVTVPAGAAEVPERLAGWGIAAALGTAAALLIWPARPPSAARQRAAAAARALADLVEGSGAEAAARERLAAARRAFLALGQRPTGTGGRTAALGRLLEDLGWILRYAPAADAAGRSVEARAEIEARVPVVLRNLAGRLEGGPAPPGADEELAALDRAHDLIGRGVLARIGALDPAAAGAEAEATAELDEAFRLRLLSFSAIEAAAATREAIGERVGAGAWAALVQADLAAGLDAARAGLDAARDSARAGRRLLRAHASMRSVWLRNSVRGAAGLALAVLIGQLADVEHAFWVVLGTTSVLRSSALATGTRIGWALLGTLAGIVVGGLLILAVGEDRTLLWIVLPFASLLAGYTPRAVSFAAGQAGFSLLVLVLFNLIEPSGWQVGLVRIEDVAIGAGVSLLVGVMLWPRGATAVLRDALAAAYAAAAELLEATVAGLLRGEPPAPAAARAAFDTGQVLDATLRDYVADRGAAAAIQDLSLLLLGARRLRQVCHLLSRPAALARLAPLPPGLPRSEHAEDRLRSRVAAVSGWYGEVGHALGAAGPPPRAAEPLTPAAVVLEARRGAGEAAKPAGPPPSVAIAWASRYLTVLEALEAGVASAAAAIGSAGAPAGRR